MTAVSVTELLGNIEKYKFNPGAMQRASLEAVRKVLDGEIDIVDATNPFVLSMETTAVNTAGFMQHTEALTRRQYSSVALTPEDLYLHMSDKDYIGRFALPSKAIWTFMFRKDELLNALVTDQLTGIKKLTIPRNTKFTIADTVFSLQYPIDIRKLMHGGLQVVWVVDKVSPLQTLSTNLIDVETQTDPDGTEFLRFDVEAFQFDVITKLNDVNSASGFKTTIPFSDSFYHVRVYTQNTLGQWVEIQTTHTQQIYDPNTPTAVIQVLDKKVNVVIPVIYTTTNQVRGKLRIDVYQTKGTLNMLLGNYSLEDFKVDWLNIDAADNNVYTAPVANLRTAFAFSMSSTIGGRPALSLEDLRSRVIQNSVGPQDIPITNVELQNTLTDGGYEIVKNIDTITNRIFLATKAMPVPTDPALITAAASGISTCLLSFLESADAHGVIVNPNGITITPEALYQTINGVTRLVTETAYATLNALSNAQKCIEVNAKTYMYTPFHYVLDASGETFEVRPYYLDNPEIVSKSFIGENATTGLQVSVDATYMIERVPTGYKLTISTKSNQAYKELGDGQVFAQLSFKPEKQLLPSFMLGVQQPRAEVTDERVYVFNINTDFDIDTDDLMDMPSFAFGPTPLTTNCKLLEDISILFASSAPPGVGLEFTAIDNALGRFQLPSNAVGVTHEKMKIRFGYSLRTLWAQARSVVGSVPYKKHLVDVPRLYEADVFDIDPVTGSSFDVVDEELVYNYLHRKDDPVLDEDLNPVMKYHVGDVVLDVFGNPVLQDNYESIMLRHVDITTIEGAYRFATDTVAAAYRKLIASSLVTWLTQDLAVLNERLLDQTKIYFYPKVTQGDVRVITRNGIETKIAAGQDFEVALHVPADTYNNPDLLTALTKTTIRTIDTSIKSLTVDISATETALRGQYGNNVIGVQVKGLGGIADYSTVTLLDSSDRLSIKKRLVAQPDGQLIIEDAVTCTFIKHEVP